MAKKQRAVPTGRLSRMGMFGSLATRVAGSMLTQGATQLLKGERPSAKDLLLTPKNIERITDQLANMRGAAMKIGQLISMDAGDLLPEALTQILGRLRSDADPMPREQIEQVLTSELGESWAEEFLYFNYVPIAAASIGQVHQAILHNGDMLALKIQYPGIEKSIDSDVDNVATLLSLSGLLPSDIDFSGILAEAKKQLHDEANYLNESMMLEKYGHLVKDDARFALPLLYPSLTTHKVLAMSFLKGAPIESLADASQTLRDHVATALFELFFNEAFEHGLIQTDPNFANYRFDSEQHKIILLDFGATRAYSPDFLALYQEILSGVVLGQKDRVKDAALSIGLFSHTVSPEWQDFVVELCFEACEPIVFDGVYDFGESDLVQRLQSKGMVLTDIPELWHPPPADSVFLHRKLGGVFLLASKLRAKINVHEMVKPFVLEC